MKIELPPLPREIATKASDTIVFDEFSIIADDREKRAGWTFQSIDAGSDFDRLVSVTVEFQRLETGDYTAVSSDSIPVPVIIERKSIEDVSSSCTNGRENFEAEHIRMAESGSSCVVIVEGNLSDIESRLQRSIAMTSVAWTRKYGVIWIWAGNRIAAANIAFGIMRTQNRFFQSKRVTETIRYHLQNLKVEKIRQLQKQQVKDFVTDLSVRGVGETRIGWIVESAKTLNLKNAHRFIERIAIDSEVPGVGPETSMAIRKKIAECLKSYF